MIPRTVWIFFEAIMYRISRPESADRFVDVELSVDIIPAVKSMPVGRYVIQKLDVPENVSQNPLASWGYATKSVDGIVTVEQTAETHRSAK
jgi:hypothetical protein